VALEVLFHWARIASPRKGFGTIAHEIEEVTLPSLEKEGGSRWMLANGLFGLWNHEVVLVTAWPHGSSPGALLATALPAGASIVAHYEFLPTVRPVSLEPPDKAGIYVHRLFGVDAVNVERFVALSNEAWQTFENSGEYESQPQGLFQQRNHPKEDGLMLLVTWYDRLESWERSRTPPPEAAANFGERRLLTKRSIAYATRLTGTNPAARGMGAG